MQNIVTHIALGNGYDAVTICNRTGVLSIMSVLDYSDYRPLGRFCLHCHDMFLFGNTRGLKKAHIVNDLSYRIEHAIRMAQRHSGWERTIANYCDLAHKYEVDLIEVLTTDAYEFLEELKQ